MALEAWQELSRHWILYPALSTRPLPTPPCSSRSNINHDEERVCRIVSLFVYSLYIPLHVIIINIEEHLHCSTNLLAARTGPDKNGTTRQSPPTARTFAFCGSAATSRDVPDALVVLFTIYKAFEEIRLPRHSQTLSDPVSTPESQSNEQVKQRWLVGLLFIREAAQWVEGKGCGIGPIWMDMCAWCVCMHLGLSCEGTCWAKDLSSSAGARSPTVYRDTIAIYTTTLHLFTPKPPTRTNIH